MEDTQEVEEVQEEVISDKTSENKEEETRDEILARHRYSMILHRLLNLTSMWATEVLKFLWFLWFSCNAYLSTWTCIFRKEISQLQKKEVEMKKQAARGSKAEQKAKKKQVEEEVSQISAKLKEKQAKELSALGYSSGNGNEKSNMDNLVKAIAGVSVSSQPENTKVSKAKQRRDKRAQQEAEREQRIQAEQNDIISDRTVENEKLERKLKPLGLTVCEIKPDGHCLYRAVENQLAHLFGGKSPYTYQQLREMAAAYMRKHTSDFLPFCLSENLIEGDSDESIAQKFENYCKEVESTAIWGGQLELGALTHCLKKHIMIFSGSFPDVEMGKEYKSADGIGSSGSSIMLSYHMHAFGLGEHYNSVVPIPI